MIDAMIDARLIVHESPYWTWSLFANQSYLGRVQMTLRRQCHGSLADLTDEEWSGLRDGLTAYESTIGALFRPDRFNYVQLGNIWPQVHVHAIPRYATPRDWNGLSFADARWGDLPLPEPASPIAEVELVRLVAAMKQALAHA